MSSQRPLMIAYRGSSGLGFLSAPPKEGEVAGFERDKSPTCKDMTFSKDGAYFAWCNGTRTIVINTSTFQEILVIESPSIMCLNMSPKGKYLATWEQYKAKENQQESCNLHIWDIKEEKCIKSFIQKRQSSWNPLWTDDEVLCARNVSNEVHFFETPDFSQISKKIFMQKVTLFSVSPGLPSYHIACYVPGVKGQPSFTRLFKYPEFEGASSVIAQKSFFKADRAEFYWNNTGKDLIVQATVDVDKNNTSYYGEQNLYYLSAKGETARIALGKDGPVYSVKWSPNCTEFCVVYGFMPAKATIYNLKCDPVFDFGTGPRNEVNYTPSGTRLALSGFGNLRGNIEVWDLKDKKKVSNFFALDSTCIEWSPNGEFLLTATTSPRLRIGNGYRIWHHSGSLLQEKFVEINDELWSLSWVPMPKNVVKDQQTVYTPVPGIESAVPQASKEVYRPPSAKGQPSKFKLHDDEPAQNETKDDLDKPLSKAQRRNLAKKIKKAEERLNETHSENDASNTNSAATIKPLVLTGDPEKDKKLRALNKKLKAIAQLKADLAAGIKLESGQIEKIKKEDELIEEMEKLRL